MMCGYILGTANLDVSFGKEGRVSETQTLPVRWKTRPIEDL